MSATYCRTCGVHYTKECDLCAGHKVSARRTRPWQYQAHLIVLTAIRRGILPKASTLQCVDCPRQAKVWDHRFYTRPLDVVPVCSGCNQRRGVAWDEEILSMQA